MVTTDTESRLLSLLRRHGPLSRQQLHERSELRPNTVGDVAGRLIERGFLTEGQPITAGPGRPQLPLAIDDSRCTVVGLALEPGSVSGGRLNLHGRPIGTPQIQPVAAGEAITTTAAAMLARLIDPSAVAVGVTTTGLFDAESRRILYSSAVPDHRPASAQPIFDAAGDRPVRFDNDMRAWAAQWQLNHPASPREDLLLVNLRDGAIGASLMIDGKPNRGCVVGGNELGYTRLPIDGRTVTLEEVFSSTFLRQLDPPRPGPLGSRLADFDLNDHAIRRVTELLALGLANAVNFVRPHRLVIASPFTQHTRFYQTLGAAMRRSMLAPVADRMRIDPWRGDPPAPAEAAGWLAMELIFRTPEPSA